MKLQEIAGTASHFDSAAALSPRRDFRPRAADDTIPAAKLVLDKLGAAVALVLFAPVMALIALLILATERGPVLYGHTRVGAGGRSFRCLKFRTMRTDSQETLDEILLTDPIAREEWRTSFKFDRDPRVTRLGDFLRRSSLDELPQIWNVLRGDMSLVGPRPITAKEAPMYGPHFAAYLSVRPGVTGLWQVSGRSDTTYDERVALDLAYVDSAGLWQDLGIICRTATAVLLRRGAV
ncbi:sugar transferase [Psychromarinibacter sp. C21-152]|uniref:Sugar transferase n=1 Tax=Psychromarinibacter sediminicola TaxID=3033385 RepID=A0AAE3TA70_9RHOB|nr:sugar transferase [Psychromarinibacter sediminicola]MDF0601689.1 sugar transferase [Psychromarinibacter sediminicola]